MEERNKPITSSQAGKAKQALQKDVMGKLDKLFRIVHALAYNNRPLNDYIWQVSLMAAGPNGFRLGQQYVNYSAAYEFLKYICKDAFSVVRKHITDAPFISIMGDDSTDVASIEQSMWYFRMCDGGSISTFVLGNTALNKADAAGIVEGLKSVVEGNVEIDWQQFMSKVICCSTDGASVMMGKKSGVIARLKQHQPLLIGIHCMPHRLELAYTKSSKAVPLYCKVIHTLAAGLYFFYANSPLNRANLKQAVSAVDHSAQESEQDIVLPGSRSLGFMRSCGTSQSDNCSADRANVSKVLMPTRPGGTRWVKHTNRALTNLIASYRYIVTHLTQVRMNHIRQRSYFYLQQIYSAFIATHDVCLYLDKLKIQMININKWLEIGLPLNTVNPMAPPSLTWINFNTNMDK